MDKNQMAVEIFDRYAKHYQDKYMDVSAYHESLNIFCEYAPKHAHILELACGPGNVTKYLHQQRPDFNILGTDLAPNMITIAQEQKPLC